MSLLELTQFYIRNWSAAPFVGPGQLPGGGGLQRPGRRGPAALVLGHRRLHRRSSVGPVLAARHRRRRCCCSGLPGPGGAAHAVPHPVRAARLRRRHHLELPAPARHRPGQPRAVDQLHADGRPAVLADRRQQLLARCWSCRSGAPGRSRSCASRPACRTSPASCTRRPRSTAPASGGRLRSVTLPMLRPVNQVLLLVLFLWTFNDFNTPYVLFGGSAPRAGRPDLHPHLPELVHHLELRLRARRCPSLLLLFLLLVTAVYLLVTSTDGGDRCVSPAG